MPQIPSRVKTAKPESYFDTYLESSLLSYANLLANIINKGIKFEDNFNGEFVTIADSGAMDTQNNVAHALNRVPAGFIVTKIDKGGVVYESGPAWTEEFVYVKCTVDNARITLFVF